MVEASIAHLLQQYRTLRLSETINYGRYSAYSLVWHSVKIEGCQLSELETRLLLEDDVVAAGKPLTDHLMVRDHYQAFLLMQELAAQQQPISTELLQQLNAAVMRNTGAVIKTVLGDFDSSRGDLRLVRVFVGQKYFPPPTIRCHNFLLIFVRKLTIVSRRPPKPSCLILSPMRTITSSISIPFPMEMVARRVCCPITCLPITGFRR